MSTCYLLCSLPSVDFAAPSPHTTFFLVLPDALVCFELGGRTRLGLEMSILNLAPGDLVIINGYPLSGSVWGVRPGVLVEYPNGEITVCPITSSQRTLDYSRLAIGPMPVLNGP